jgi:hypothetical protein
MWTTESLTSVPEAFLDAPAPTHPRLRGSARLFSNRTRRRLVRSLRQLASHTSRHRRFDVLLHDRVAPIRGDLLEIAALLERELRPDPGCVVALHRLLTDGCASPLYNRDVHPSELRATLHYVRCRLGTSVDSLPSDTLAARY